MPERTMGSHRGLTTKEAAVILGVCENTALAMESDGLLRREDGLFRDEDVHELASARTLGQRGDPLIAKKALAIALRTERQLEELKNYLGMTQVTLGLEEQDVLSFVRRIKKLDNISMLRENTSEWIGLLAVIDENYLTLVEAYTGEQEPWSMFMRVAQWLYENAPDNETRARVDYMRKNLRNVAYLYARQKYGIKRAEKQFSDESFTARMVTVIIGQ